MAGSEVYSTPVSRQFLCWGKHHPLKYYHLPWLCFWLIIEFLGMISSTITLSEMEYLYYYIERLYFLQMNTPNR